MEFTSWNPKELYHFGTKGMKWGQRRFQNPDGSLTPLGEQRYGKHGLRSARGTKRDLNKLDRELTNAKARRDDYQSWVDRKVAKAERKAAKYQTRANNGRKSAESMRYWKKQTEAEGKAGGEAHRNHQRLEQKFQKFSDKNQRKADKAAALSDRIRKYQQKAKDYSTLVKRNEALTNKIIANSRKRGYSIRSKDVLRPVNTGRNVAASVLGTAAGIGLGALTGTYVTGATAQYAQGKRYKVRNDGLGTRTHRSARRLVYARTYDRNRR